MISSPSNQHIAELHALHAAKGRAEAEEAFLIEGPHLLEAAMDAHVDAAADRLRSRALRAQPRDARRWA